MPIKKEPNTIITIQNFKHPFLKYYIQYERECNFSITARENLSLYKLKFSLITA